MFIIRGHLSDEQSRIADTEEEKLTQECGWRKKWWKIDERGDHRSFNILIYKTALYLHCFVKELLANEDTSSVYIMTVNKEKYRCSLPPISKTSNKASICVICDFVYWTERNYSITWRKHVYV